MLVGQSKGTETTPTQGPPARARLPLVSVTSSGRTSGQPGRSPGSGPTHWAAEGGGASAGHTAQAPGERRAPTARSEPGQVCAGHNCLEQAPL